MCTNTCANALEGMGSYFSNVTFPEANVPTPKQPWLLRSNPFQNGYEFNGRAFGYNHEFDTLRIRHCLAEPIQQRCKVGLSNSLLLVVIICLFVKVVAGILVVCWLPTTSLVSPGDAIQSFVMNPDPVTKNICSLDIRDAWELEVSHNCPYNI